MKDPTRQGFCMQLFMWILGGYLLYCQLENSFFFTVYICHVSCMSLVLQLRIKEDQLYTQNYIVADVLFQFPA